MKLELELNGQALHALSEDELPAVLALSGKDSQGYPCLVDLRKRHEMETSPAAQCKQQGISYVPVPITSQTLSEQDMDFVRRECARHWGRLALVSKGGQRAAAVLLMHAGRSGRWSQAETLEKFPQLDEDLKRHLTAYLERHLEREQANQK